MVAGRGARDAAETIPTMLFFPLLQGQPRRREGDKNKKKKIKKEGSVLGLERATHPKKKKQKQRHSGCCTAGWVLVGHKTK